MSGTTYLFFAFSVTWLFIFMYILSVSRRQKSLETQLQKLEAILKEKEEQVG